VTIAIHLSLKNAGSLKELATRVSSPASPQYGHYLTPAEIGLLFAPAAADVSAAEALLVHAGMTDVTVGPHGAYVSATATVAQLRTTFGITQDLYKYAGLTLRANREEPTLPAALAGKVLYVEGLDDSGVFRHPFHRSVTQGPLRAPATAAASVTPPPVAAGNPSPYCNKFFGPGESVATLSTAADVYGAAIPWLNCGYAPGNIRAAYGLDKTKYNGAGVTVAILDAYASPTLLADSNRYAVHHGLLPLIPGRNFAESIPIGIYDVSPDEVCAPYGWWTEQSLDMAAVHGAAPGAHILYIGSRDCGTSLTIALENAVYNHVADIITNSWGDGGESIAPGEAASTDQALMAAAAEGMTVLFSSGDDGDLSALNGVATGAWPATSPWVTGVGGTSLLLHADGTKSEYGWGTYRAFLTDVKVNSAKSVTDSGVWLHLRRLLVLRRVRRRHQSYRTAARVPSRGRSRSARHDAESRERLLGSVVHRPAGRPRCGHGRGSLHRLSLWRDLHHRRQSDQRCGLHSDFGHRGVLRRCRGRHQSLLTAHGRRDRGHEPEAQRHRPALGRLRESAVL
jgi:subtilase family serine protease